MNPGRFDRPIIFQRATTEQSASGEVLPESWSNIGRDWASILSRQGTEVNENGQLIGRHYFSIRVRYRTDITVKDRILYEGRELYISSISNDVPNESRNTVTEFMATETL